MASSTDYVPRPSQRPGGERSWRIAGRHWLFAAAFFSGAIALFVCHDTWVGMRGAVGAPFETFLASIGLQGVLYVFAWLIAFALLRGQRRRLAGLSLGFLLALVPAVLFCTTALYLNLSTPRSLQAVADLEGGALGQRLIEPLSKKLQAEQARSADALQETTAYVQWSARVDRLVAAAQPASGARSDAPGPQRATLTVPQVNEIRALRQQKTDVDARVSSWDAQINEQNRLIEQEARGEGTSGCADQCKRLEAKLMQLVGARTPDLARQGTLAKQLQDLEGGPDVTQLQRALREARERFKKSGDPARLDAAVQACHQLQTAMSSAAYPAGDVCTLEDSALARQELTGLAAIRTQLAMTCMSGDPFHGIAFEAALALAEGCLGLARPARVSLGDEERAVLQLRQAYNYLPHLKESSGAFIRNLSPLRNADKMQIAANGLHNHDGSLWIAGALALIFNLLIPALAWAGAAARSAGAEASRREAAPLPDIRPIPTDEPQVRAIKLILRAVVTDKGEQLLEIEDPCRHPDPNVKDIANLLVAQRELLASRHRPRFYRLAPGAYGRLKDRLGRAMAATIVTVLPPKLEKLQPSKPKAPPRGRASFFSED